MKLKISRYIWQSGLILSLVWLTGCSQNEKQVSGSGALPIMGERMGETTKTVNGKQVKDTVYHTIPDFKFTNQDGKAVTRSDFDGSIYVADFFFTSCPSICPITQTNMLQVQKHFKNVKGLKMISFSIDPKHDSEKVLKEYATRIGADTRQWQFVRGDEDETYILAQKGFLASAMKDANASGGYAHSGAFVLVDKEKRIRGMYNGVDSTAVSQLIKDIPRLFKEYNENVKAE